jgi:hypothetical protein
VVLVVVTAVVPAERAAMAAQAVMVAMVITVTMAAAEAIAWDLGLAPATDPVPMPDLAPKRVSAPSKGRVIAMVRVTVKVTTVSARPMEPVTGVPIRSSFSTRRFKKGGENLLFAFMNRKNLVPESLVFATE